MSCRDTRLGGNFFEERSDVLRRVYPESTEDGGCWNDISLRVQDVCPLKRG